MSSSPSTSPTSTRRSISTPSCSPPEPAKVRPGYANFAVADPPLKLVLIENAAEAPGSLNHLGIEVETDRRGSGRAGPALQPRSCPPRVEEQVSCCYAVQDKVWVDGPGGEPWEIYTVLADAEMPSRRASVGRSERGRLLCEPTRPCRRRRRYLRLLLNVARPEDRGRVT